MNLERLRLPALRIEQSPARHFYAFAIDGKQLPDVAAISRISRSESYELNGYQRPHVRAHIAAIREYIESPDALLPSGLLIAFDSRVTFTPAGRQANSSPGYVTAGILEIPLDRERKSGWVVDGQQRIAAIAESGVHSLPVLVSAFITESVDEQRGQFILVNASKPLPKGLVTELLPGTETLLPRPLRRRRLPATLMERLNHDPGSPFQNLIQSPTTPTGVVKDNSVIRMIENSLTDGALYHLRGSTRAEAKMLALLTGFWSAVSRAFPDAWGLPPRRSRLTHGVGIVSLGFLMDAVASRATTESLPDFEAALTKIAPACAWTAGAWTLKPDGIERRWNDLQNTPSDIALLTEHLRVTFESGGPKERKRSAGRVRHPR